MRLISMRAEKLHERVFYRFVVVGTYQAIHDLTILLFLFLLSHLLFHSCGLRRFWR